MKIIERIFSELEKAGKKDVELANALGVTTAQVSMWKSRKTDPPAKYMTKIAELLNISTDYLITGEEKIIETIKSTNCSTYELLVQLCKNRGINITQLCVKVTGSSGNLQTWKNHDGHMRSDYLKKCADELNVSVDYLLGRTDDPTIHYLNEKQFKLVARGGKNIDTTNKNTPTGKTPRTTKK